MSEQEDPALEVLIRGGVGTGKSSLQELIYKALREHGILPECYDCERSKRNAFIPSSEVPVRNYDARRIVIITSTEEIPQYPKWNAVQKQGLLSRLAALEKWACRHCGCTNEECGGCVRRTGEPCHWVGDRLCSACVGKEATDA